MSAWIDADSAEAILARVPDPPACADDRALVTDPQRLCALLALDRAYERAAHIAAAGAASLPTPILPDQTEEPASVSPLPTSAITATAPTIGEDVDRGATHREEFADG